MTEQASGSVADAIRVIETYVHTRINQVVSQLDWERLCTQQLNQWFQGHNDRLIPAIHLEVAVWMDKHHLEMQQLLSAVVAAMVEREVPAAVDRYVEERFPIAEARAGWWQSIREWGRRLVYGG